MTPILVTGALGNVGAEVARRLRAQGCAVRVADVDEEELSGRFALPVKVVRFDFRRPETYHPAFEGVEKMFLVRPPRIGNVQRDMFPALEAARGAGVKHVVFLSVIGIEKAAFIPHSRLERYLKKLDLQTTFLRCSFFMQNLNTTHLQEIRERSQIQVPVGNARTSFIDVRDIGAAAAVTLTAPGHAGRNYTLTGAESLDYWEAARIMSDVLGRRITYRNPNPLQFLLGTIRRGLPVGYALVMLGLYTSTRFGMAEPVTDEVEELTGMKPIGFRQYVQDYREMWI